ncbi:hypothetical protein QAD02_024127 [Eretmocerus hayati]|uniref:Uncharacterized protein n=1 Tax=Eretmocerus hayati TaxID=131215 RepID=A0ACC2Q189_9HYME|nr:hypothetical protein QAD02_024127 [Eretmocerus hayati]
MEAMHLFFENGVWMDNCGVQFPLHRAAANSEVGILEYLLKTRLYNVDAMDKTGATALFIAVVHERLDCVRMLIEWSANVDTPTEPKSELETAGRSPLSQAVSKGNLEIVDLLLSFGAKIHLNFGTGDKKCFMNALRDWSRIDLTEVKVLNFDITWRCLFGRVLLSQSHVHEINTGKSTLEDQIEFLPELDSQYQVDIIRATLSELDALKSVSFYDGRDNPVTLFDLLHGKEITRYMNNAQVIHKYKLLGVSERFPIYGHLIETRFSIAHYKRKLMDEAVEKLCQTLGSYSWSCGSFFYDVMTHLSIRDLQNLSEI